MGWHFDSDRPIYTQLAEHIQFQIAAGVYLPGSKLPSVRDLAAEAEVNPNTMQRALAELEMEGLIFAQRTAGRFVTRDTEAVNQSRQRLFQSAVEAFLKNMGSLGCSPQQSLEILKHHVEGLH